MNSCLELLFVVTMDELSFVVKMDVSKFITAVLGHSLTAHLLVCC